MVGCSTDRSRSLGHSILCDAQGYDSPEPGAPPINPDGVFWIASCSKLIGTIAALQCVECGQIELDDPVHRILPELNIPDVICKAQPGETNAELDQRYILKPTQCQITLRQLLTHTSGLGYDFLEPTLMAWRKSRGQTPLGLSGNLIDAYKTPLLFEPGQGWAYGSGIDWAGELVARLNETTLENYIQKHICKPLGITSMTFRLEQYPKLKDRMIKTSARAAGGNLTPSQKPWPDVAAEDCAGAGLYSSVQDYLKVLQDIISDEPLLLKVRTIEEEMFTPQLHEGSRAFKDLGEATRVISIMAGATGVAPGGINCGFGGIYTTKDAGFTREGTLIWGGYPNLTWLANRKRGIAALYATQVVPPGDAKCMELAHRFFAESWERKESKRASEVTTSIS